MVATVLELVPAAVQATDGVDVVGLQTARNLGDDLLVDGHPLPSQEVDVGLLLDEAVELGRCAATQGRAECFGERAKRLELEPGDALEGRDGEILHLHVSVAPLGDLVGVVVTAGLSRPRRAERAWRGTWPCKSRG